MTNALNAVCITSLIWCGVLLLRNEWDLRMLKQQMDALERFNEAHKAYMQKISTEFRRRITRIAYLEHILASNNIVFTQEPELLDLEIV